MKYNLKKLKLLQKYYFYRLTLNYKKTALSFTIFLSVWFPTSNNKQALSYINVCVCVSNTSIIKKITKLAPMLLVFFYQIKRIIRWCVSSLFEICEFLCMYVFMCKCFSSENGFTRSSLYFIKTIELETLLPSLTLNFIKLIFIWQNYSFHWVDNFKLHFN